MRTILQTAICSLVIIFCFSCKCRKNAATAATNTTQTSKDETMRLVVSFYSIGAGTDMKAHDEFRKFLDSYPKKISYEPTPWGREGEVDYCLKLSELLPSEQKDFVKKTQELLSKSTLVHVDENAKCVHKD